MGDPRCLALYERVIILALATTLLKLWKLRLWVGLGAVLATLAAAASMTLLHSTVYASASTVMLVDSPQSALANSSIDLSGYDNRAATFARLMTSTEALRYIGSAAGIAGNLIDASGPMEINGATIASHAPTAAPGASASTSKFKLAFNQNPLLPTVEVDAEAPTTAQAIALANGAVTGFATFLTHLEASHSVPDYKRVVIRALGAATGGIVDPGAPKSIAALIWIVVLGFWCALVLWFTSFRGHLRAAKAAGTESQSGPVPPTGPGDLAYGPRFGTSAEHRRSTPEAGVLGPEVGFLGPEVGVLGPNGDDVDRVNGSSDATDGGDPRLAAYELAMGGWGGDHDDAELGDGAGIRHRPKH